MTILKPTTNSSIAKILNYSFNPIGWEYKNLTVTEKKLVSKSEFENLKKLYADGHS